MPYAEETTARKLLKALLEKIEVMEMSPKDKWLYESRMKYEHDRAS